MTLNEFSERMAVAGQKRAMEISLLLKVVGVGILVAVSGQILQKTGRDELSTWITVAGIVFVLVMLLGQIGQLFTTIRSIFGL